MRQFVSHGVVLFGLLACLGLGTALAQSVQVQTTDGTTPTEGEHVNQDCSMSPLGGGNCLFPMCWEAEIEYDPNSVSLDSVDLHEPDDPQKGNAKVWMTLKGNDINQDVQDQAIQQLKQGLGAKHYDQPCLEKDCTCTMPQGAQNWGPWETTQISAQLDIANPNPKDPKVNDRLYYTVHGTAKFHGKGRVGHCDVPDVEE